MLFQLVVTFRLNYKEEIIRNWLFKKIIKALLLESYKVLTGDFGEFHQSGHMLLRKLGSPLNVVLSLLNEIILNERMDSKGSSRTRLSEFKGNSLKVGKLPGEGG